MRDCGRQRRYIAARYKASVAARAFRFFNDVLLYTHRYFVGILYNARRQSCGQGRFNCGGTFVLPRGAVGGNGHHLGRHIRRNICDCLYSRRKLIAIRQWRAIKQKTFFQRFLSVLPSPPLPFSPSYICITTTRICPIRLHPTVFSAKLRRCNARGAARRGRSTHFCI